RERPAVVGPAHADVDFLEIVGPDVSDEESLAARLEVELPRVPKSQRPDARIALTAIEERVAGRRRAVAVDVQDLPLEAMRVLGHFALLLVVAGRQVQRLVRREPKAPTVME